MGRAATFVKFSLCLPMDNAWCCARMMRAENELRGRAVMPWPVWSDNDVIASLPICIFLTFFFFWCRVVENRDVGFPLG